MRFLVVILLFMSFGLSAADLPDQGLEPPQVVYAPGDKPPNPGTPVGNGVAIVAGFAVLYAISKKKRK